MGCYDIFVGKVKCPHCGGILNFSEQTKNYECIFSEFKIGDYIDKGDKNYFYEFSYPCNCCMQVTKIYAAVKNGQLIGYYTDISGININKMENIEANYERKQEYKRMCEVGYGTDKPMFEPGEYFKVGDTIHILERDWVVDKVYKEVLKENISNERLQQFYSMIYKDNRCYLVHDEIGNKRFVLTRELMDTIICAPSFTENEDCDVEDFVAYCNQSGTVLKDISQ